MIYQQTNGKLETFNIGGGVPLLKDLKLNMELIKYVDLIM